MHPQSSTSPEEWRPVVGHEGRYEVSDLGHVRRIISLPKHPVRVDGHLRPGKTTSGYLFLCLYPCGGDTRPRNHFVHRLVLEAFTGPFAPGEQTNHINGIKADNRLINLEKVTPTQNMKHAVGQGLCKPNRRGQPGLRGEESPAAKLTAADVRRIRTLGYTVRGADLAREYGVSPATICLIRKGVNWRHLAPTPLTNGV